jgi:DNA-directed RNA polymerase subunit alpha
MMAAALQTIMDQIRAGQHDEAREALNNAVVTDENRSELKFLQGYLLEVTHEREAALAVYGEVLEMDPEHTEAAFRAAVLCDMGGDSEAALNLYRRCAAEEPAHVNALINLAILHEDCGELAEAERCLEDVLNEYPNHPRARQLLKSVKSSYTMVFDEKTQQEREQRDAVLDMSISDFELSVRSRNCLRQMNIRTLGDLLKTTEAELLSYKNFGETSLNEIKAMLAQKGLWLGQALQPVEQPSLPELVRAVGPQVTEPPTGVTGTAQTSIANLELSVRSRKALQRLGVTTIGELAQHTEVDLMAIKNFGQTSLNEIKRARATYGLSLRKPG